MVENNENSALSLTLRDNEKRPEVTKMTGKEAGLLQNANRKKIASQKRRKVSIEGKGGADMVDLKEQSSKTETLCADDRLLDRMESLDVYEDDQGAPSFKSFCKAVKTFSKRKPKSPKIREEVARERKETDVVVFERLATPRSFYKSSRVSRSLPPIMDIHDLLSSEIQLEEEKLGRDLDSLQSEDMLRASNTEEPYNAITSWESPSDEPPAGERREIRRHRCSGFLHELEPDALQEFGSFDVSVGNRDRERRKSRKSLGYLCSTFEEQEALHF